MKLYELTQEYQRLLEAVEAPDASGELVLPSTGEVLSTDAFGVALAALQDGLEAKVHGCACARAALVAYAEACAAEERRLAARRRALEAAVERLEQYVRSNMAAAGLSKVKGPLYTVSLSKEGRERAEILDADAVPDAFVRRVEVHLDKAAILAALKKGEEVSGAMLGRGERVLTVR